MEDRPDLAPSILVPAPCAFAISTARTGGGKYDPEDIRFQILYRLPCRSFSNSAIDCPSTPGAPLLALTFCHASRLPTSKYRTACLVLSACPRDSSRNMSG